MPSGLPQITVRIESTAKPWWRSWTLWFNALCVTLASAELALGVLKEVLPGNVYAWLAFALAVGNALLRLRTSTAIVGMQRPCPAIPPESNAQANPAAGDSLPDPLKGCT